MATQRERKTGKKTGREIEVEKERLRAYIDKIWDMVLN